MGAKEEISHENVTRADVEALLQNFPFPFPLAEFKVLFGGYSGTSIKVVGAKGEAFVLKICHGYEKADVEAQARVAVYARTHGFSEACTAIALKGQTGVFSVERKSDKTPCCLLTFVDGVAADKVAESGTVTASAVLQAVGSGLGRLHSVPPPSTGSAAAASVRTVETNGACDVRKHLSGEISEIFASSLAVKGHAFLPFYEEQVASLQRAFTADGLPRGVLHGDPFLDNILVSPLDGHLEGFVDLEDVCIGPLLFDIACCASACCFRPHDNALDARRLRVLLTGYAAARPLSEVEKSLFVDFMKLTMLCNWCVPPPCCPPLFGCWIKRPPAPSAWLGLARLRAHHLAALSRRCLPSSAARGASRTSTLTTASSRAAATRTWSCRSASRRSRTT